MRYERRGWRAIREGDRIKDPRGVRVIESASRNGYRLEPSTTSTDGFAEYSWMKPWPKVGRLKVVTHIDVRMITVEGRLGPDVVGVNVTAGLDEPPEMYAITTENAIKALRHMHPGVERITAGDWRTITVPLDDVD